jgi:hypothetical protein
MEAKMNIIYLLKILNTNKISELVANIDLPPIDINLAIWDAVNAGEVEVDEEKDRIAPLKECVPSCDNALADKLLRVAIYYASKQTNITRGTLNHAVKDPISGRGYPWHEYLMALQWLVDTKQLEEYEVSVPEVKGKRPYHKFVFLGLPTNPNEEWNSREVNKWMARFDSKKKKK